jgi:hypothetical protein
MRDVAGNGARGNKRGRMSRPYKHKGGQNRWRQECAGMGKRLTEGAIAPAMLKRNFSRRRRMRSGNLGDVAWRRAVEMRLGQIALERKGESGHEHDKAGRGTQAPDSTMSR